MPSQTLPVRRQRASDADEDGDGDDDGVRFRDKSSIAPEHLSKRPRYSLHYDSQEHFSSSHREDSSEAFSSDQDGLQRPGKGSEYQPGAIVRVEVTNFVTYENAVFHPGPNLNMVIGPNGTGKSSLVCAICLGLGYAASHLGRAAKVGEFVKHGKEDATIEIELQRSLGGLENHVVRVKIIRDGDKRKWWINGSETSLKAVQTLTRGLGIQVDNLCQFLPQDRVSEFAGLSPVELLHETQRAAAPEEMLSWHAELKELHKEQKALQIQHDTDGELLANMEERQENLRGDVERLQERAQIQEKITLLQKTTPFVEYRIARKRHFEQRKKKSDAQKRLKELERQVEPMLRAVNAKQEYQKQLDLAVTERRKLVETSERATDIAVRRIEQIEESITQVEQRRKAEIESDKARKQEMQVLQRKLAELQARLQNAPPDFDGADWNARIREGEQNIRHLDAEGEEITEQEMELMRRGKLNRNQIENAQEELSRLDSQAGKQANKLRIVSQDTAKAWEWIQQNQDLFEKPIFGPPLVECSIKDPRYTDVIESLFQRNDFLTITAQTKADFKKLGDQLYQNMKLAEITLKTVTDDLTGHRSPLSQQQIQQLGFDGWAIDYIEGPETVLSMLCNGLNLHATGVSLQPISEEQFASILNSPVTNWVSGRHSYRITRRREYGPGATSTTTRNVRNATMWTDQPMDLTAKRDLEQQIEAWREEFATMKETIESKRQRKAEIKAEKAEGLAAVAKLKSDKNELQKAAGQYAALPAKIEREKENLQQKKQAGEELRQRLQDLSLKNDTLVMEKASLCLQHKDCVNNLRLCHDALIEAEIRFIEATSDVEALKERNQGIAEGLNDERALVAEVEKESKAAKSAAEKALEVCKVTLVEDEANAEYFRTIDPDLTLEDLQHEIEAEKSKLDYIHGGNAGALKEFEVRQVAIEKLSDKIGETSRKLDRLKARIADAREKWEPELDRLVRKISDAFSYNFEQIGCAGEVTVHKDEDFDLWSIEIKVKFRETESLQLLDQHRQSGGERSVSTIFYLMSLQSLARAPFRVVDEINQGMDPRNERMVHERMVEIACKEHTSQYFLITPKLLTGLRYVERMKVLCIASGEHMPRDHKLLDLGRAIRIRRRLNERMTAVAV